MPYVNLVDNPAYRRADFGASQWYPVSGATLRRSSRYTHSGAASLQVTATAATAVVRSHRVSDAYLPEVSAAAEYRASIWFRHATPGRQVTLAIDWVNAAGSTISSVTATGTMSYDEWTLVQVVGVAPTGATNAVIAVSFTGVDLANGLDATVFLDDPALVENVALGDRFISGLGAHLPEYLTSADDAQTNPTVPLMRFLDLLAYTGETVIDLFEAISYTSLVDGGDPLDTSSLVDIGDYPDSATREEWIPWIAQHLGVRALTVPGGGTTWSSFAGLATWEAWEDSINPDSPTPVAISSLVRSTGTVTVTTAAAHGLVVGDTVTVTNAGSPTFEGAYRVDGVGTSTQFSYTQVVAIEAISRAGTTVTVTTLAPHRFSVGQQIVVTSVSPALDGTFTVASVPASQPDDLATIFTYATAASGAVGEVRNQGAVRPQSPVSATGGSMLKESDLTWSYIQQTSEYPIEPDTAVAYLIRTGATGTWAGTIEGMRRAARLPLSGVDTQAALICVDGVLTVTCVEPHGFTVGSSGHVVEIYASPNDAMNRIFAVTSVLSDTSFTVPFAPVNDTQAGWVTTRQVGVQRGFWAGTIASVSTTGGTITVELSEQLPLLTTSGPVTITGTSITALNATHTPVSVTVAADRRSVSFPSTVAVPAPIYPDGAMIRLVGNRFCFIVRTLRAQSPNSEAILAFARQAKPAGGIITHEYTD